MLVNELVLCLGELILCIIGEFGFDLCMVYCSVFFWGIGFILGSRVGNGIYFFFLLGVKICVFVIWCFLFISVLIIVR